MQAPAGSRVAPPREFDEVVRTDLKWLDTSAERPTSRRGSGAMRPALASGVASTVFGSEIWS